MINHHKLNMKVKLYRGYGFLDILNCSLVDKHYMENNLHHTYIAFQRIMVTMQGVVDGTSTSWRY